MRNKDVNKILLIWDPYFSKEENIIFEEFLCKLLKDYEPLLVVLTAEEIKIESFNNIIAAIVFSDSARTVLSKRTSNIGLAKLPVILSIISQQIDFPSKDIRAFPSAKTVGELLAKALFKEEGGNDNVNILSFFLPKETAEKCAKAFESSLKWLYPKINPNIIICDGESTENLITQYKEKVDSKTCIVIYGYDTRYNELLRALIAQSPKRIISEFNTPDSLVNTPNLSYICFETPLTGVTLFKKIALTLLDTLHLYIKSIDKSTAIEQQRDELRKLLLNQSRFRKTQLGTFHFTENNDFFCPFYLKSGTNDRVELIEGIESPAEIAVTALSECNKWLDKFTYSTKTNAFEILLEDISHVLKYKLFCERFSIVSQKINQWYPDNPKDWEFMLEFPCLFDSDTFWEKSDMDSISVKNIQIALGKPDLENFASYRIYVNNREPFVEYLHSNKNRPTSLSVAKCIDEEGIKNISSKKKEVGLFVDMLKKKCDEMPTDISYIYIIFLKHKQGQQNLQQHVCYCFFTKEKLGIFELTILENIAVIINHTIFEIAYKNELLKESIKSAISAIMARNMSHNLGSHFISNTKHYFSNLADNDEDKQRQKDYRGIRHTLQYIQERMDFIATIVSTDRFPYGPVNVKSQIFDELTPDEFGGRHEKKTTNFLLDYIVFSEDISKQSNLSKSSIKLSLKLISDNGKEFGGQGRENQEAKEEFAKLNLAVPGGILGRHAIFTIIENVIRNSAKHDKENIPKEGLNVSIKIGKNYIIIFDNKKNAKKNINGTILIDELQKRYTDIKILSDGAIDKSNKGLKEILISTLWLNNYSLADWFGEYENTSTEDKIKKLSEVLKIVTVEDNGNITDNGENLGYYIALDKYEEVYHIEENMVKGDKIYYSSISGIKADIIAANRDYEVLIDENLGQNGDASTDSNNIMRLSDLYPRFFENKDEKEFPQTEEMMKAIIARNTGMKLVDLEGIDIHIEPKDYNILADKSKKNHCIWHAKGEASGIKKNDILYKNHLSTLSSEEIDRVLAAYEDAAYIDSISGGDFTGTITQPFFLENEFNRLKVIESALTEFIIIDERVFKNYGHGLKQLDGSAELESRESILQTDKIFNEVEEQLSLGTSIDDITDNIRNRYGITLQTSLLNGDNKDQIREDVDKKITKRKNEASAEEKKTESNFDNISALHKMIEKRKLHIYDIDKNGNILNLEGENVANVINSKGKENLCSPTFLSIHLSIIEKITKENDKVRASQVMENLKALFGDTKFVTIHSGRGNLSAELEKDLKDYAFLSLSAIQAAMDDSKYFLSQLLYNNCYIGKGRLNHK